MNDKICGACEYALKTATGALMCVRHKMYVTEVTNACNGYFNYKKEQIYKRLLGVFGSGRS